MKFFTTSNLPVTVASLLVTTALFILIHIPHEVLKVNYRRQQIFDQVEEDSKSEAFNSKMPEESNFDLKLCGCSRSVQVNAQEDGVAFEDTTCGLDAFRRGSGQKVWVSQFVSCNAIDTLRQTLSDYHKEKFPFTSCEQTIV